MPDATHCAECGAEIAAGQPRGLCSRCAFKGALELADDDSVSTAAMPDVPQTGERIGRYKLLEKIGEGGCGIVYMAEQEQPVRRRVALKIIKPGMDTREVIARFEAERQALALMEHPHIAKIFDGGATDSGRPYFVMELVRGLRITDYCDQKKISTRQRLDLFMQVCQAVQHAHQKGIIHRDLKPSNILVTVNDGVPVPKVIDFGIAKATGQRLTDKTFFTRFQQLIGTPAYMSPEQAEMTSVDIDTRSDIYSLGVLLYELLTGRTPFDAGELLRAGMEEMLRTIREHEPVRPSVRLNTLAADEQTTVARQRHTESVKLFRLLRGDLDWIVMKAIEKDRTRRYETAYSLGLDVQRHLTNEPVAAGPPTTRYRLRKFMRKHRAPIAVSAGVLLVSSLGLGGWVSAWNASDRAKKHETETTAILQANHTALVQQALADGDNAQGSLWLKQLDVGISKQRTNYALWQTKAVVLERRNEPDQAIEQISKAIDLAMPAGESPAPEAVNMLLRRASLFRQLGRRDKAEIDYDRAGRIQCQMNGFIRRDANSEPELIDLSPIFEGNVYARLNIAPRSETALTLPETIRSNTGLKFDIRGYRYLPQKKALQDPLTLSAHVPVNLRLLRLNVLHGTENREAEGTKIGAYILNYADGQKLELPIVYGQHLRGEWERNDDQPTPKARLAWTDMNGPNNVVRGKRLYSTKIENPHLNKEIKTVSFYSSNRKCKPFVVAITVEPPQSGTPEYWVAQAGQFEEKGDWDKAVAVLNRGLQELNDPPLLWDAKGELLTRSKKADAAIQAFSRSIELAEEGAGKFDKVKKQALLHRSDLLREMNRFAEAGRDNCAGRDIPLREPQTVPEQIDLSAFYNYNKITAGSEMARLFAEQVKRATGVGFDVRAYVKVSVIDNEWVQWPDSVTGIPVNFRCARIHFLHSTDHAEGDGTHIGSYKLHFANGQSEELQLFYGENIRAWVQDYRPTKEARFARFGDGVNVGGGRNVFVMTWTNQYPNLEVKKLDFISTRTVAGPQLIAVTVERAP